MNILGHITDVMGDTWCRFSHDPDLAPLGFEQPQHELEQGGLPAAVGADHGDEIPFPNLQIDVLEHALPVVGKGEIRDPDDGVAACGII